MPDNIPSFKRITDTYSFLGLPTDQIDQQSEFDIHTMQSVHVELPSQSPVFRANYFTFVFVKDAVGHFMIEEQPFEVLPGTIYFTNPGHIKSFGWQQIETVYLVSLSEAFLKENVHARIYDEFAFLLAETVVNKALEPSVFAEFDQLCGQLLAAYTSNSPHRYKIIGSLFRVVLLKIEDYFWQDYNPIYEGNRSSQIVREFKRCLEQHFRELNQPDVKNPKALRVQDCAEAQHLHPNYLSTVIKSKTGKSVSTWIIEKTIGEAKSMLKNTPLSIKEIAYRLGFIESTHFSTYFRKYTGQSPIACRRHQPSA
ncbi:helix-turn-helix domain-containing protein [Spirosoma arcticum]